MTIKSSLEYLDRAVRKTGEEPFFWYSSLPIVGTLPGTCLATYNLIRMVDRLALSLIFGAIACFSREYVSNFKEAVGQLGEFSTLFAVSALGVWTLGLVTSALYIQRLYVYIEQLQEKVSLLEKR